MFSLFLGFASCLFVPFNVSEVASFTKINADTLSEYISKNPIVIALSCPTENYLISHSFTNSEPIFPEAVFVIVEDGAMKKYLDQKVPLEPSIAIFKNGTLSVIVGPIYEASSLLYIIDLYLYEKRPVLQSAAEVVAALGETPVTVITSANDFDHTFSNTKKILSKAGPINIVSLSKKAAGEINLSPGTCAIYRSIDQVLEPIQCTSKDIQSGLKPSFDKAKVEMLTGSTKPCVVFHTFESDSPQVKDFMYKLGSNFKDFNFFLVNDKEACKLVDKYYQNTFCQLTRIGVIDFKAHIAYNVSSIIDTLELETQSFDSRKMTTNVSHLIYQIRNHAVPHFYMSEPLQKPSKSPLKRIVGLNYKEMIEENDTDVLVLYLKPRSNTCSKAFSKFRSIADDALDDCGKDDNNNVNQTNSENATNTTEKAQICNRDINTHIKFYFIIATDNFVEGGYPTYPDEPSIVLFSALDKTKPRLVVGTDQADIQLHLKLFAKYPVNFTTDYSLGTMDHFNEQAEFVKSVRGRMTVEEAELLMDTIDKVSAEFKKSNNESSSDQKTDEL